MKFGGNRSSDSTSNESQLPAGRTRKVYHKGPWSATEDELLRCFVKQ